MDLSLIMPAYKGLGKIPKTLRALKFSGKYEVIVAGDMLSKKDTKFLRNHGVRVIASSVRRGKVNALNAAAEKARGELLVFMDSDTRPESRDFLEGIWRNYKQRDFEIGSGRIMVEGKSWVERSINVEYLFMNAAVFMGNLFKKPAPMNGAFVIVTKDAFARIGGFSRVIVEDFDIGFKANKVGLRFFYMKDVTVLTSSPKKMRDWFAQRHRWIMGGSQSINKSKRDIVKNAPLTVAALTSYYPIPTLSVLSLALVLLALPTFNPIYLLSITAMLTTGLMITMNKVLDWGLSLSSGLSYLLWYGPLWSAFSLFAVIYFTVLRKHTPKDWVV